MRNKHYIALLLLLVTFETHAQSKSEEPKNVQWLLGVWQGKLGDSPVTVCFNSMNYGSQRGSYFYHRHLIPISLSSERTPGDFQEFEGQSKHRWQIQASADFQQITGKRIKDAKPDETPQVLPITLKRVGNWVYEDSSPCGSETYFKKLIRPLPLIKDKVQEFEGKQYQVIRRELKGTGKVESIQLLGDEERYKEINAFLLKGADSAELFECLRNGLNGSGSSWDSWFNGISVWGQKWLVTASAGDVFCGGAHPDNWIYHHTFNLEKGREADLSAWFKGLKNDASERYKIPSQISPGKSLKKLILSHSHAAKEKDQNCLDSLEFYNSYEISIAKTGINFQPILARVVQACGEDITVPLAKLIPFLTPLGKREVDELQAGNF